VGDGHEVYRALMQDLWDEQGCAAMANLIGQQLVATLPPIKFWYADAYDLWLAIQEDEPQIVVSLSISA
jgi:hypothetical protein